MPAMTSFQVEGSGAVIRKIWNAWIASSRFVDMIRPGTKNVRSAGVMARGLPQTLTPGWSVRIFSAGASRPARMRVFTSSRSRRPAGIAARRSGRQRGRGRSPLGRRGGEECFGTPGISCGRPGRRRSGAESGRGRRRGSGAGESDEIAEPLAHDEKAVELRQVELLREEPRRGAGDRPERPLDRHAREEADVHLLEAPERSRRAGTRS